MKQALSIFKGDFKRLLKSWAAVIVIAGVLVLPALYAWFNIAANMDPYGNTGAIKVAVANLDKGAKSDNMDINAGDSIVETLKTNDQLGWCFVGEDEALDGVKSGEYYAAIVIPEDFSQSFLGILNGTIEKPSLDYYVNDKLNAVAPKITETGASTVQQKVNDTFTKIASEVISNMIKETAGELSTSVANASDKALTTIGNVQGNIKKSYSILDKFQNNIYSGAQKIPQAINTLNKVSTAAKSSATALKEAQSSIEQARTSLGEFSTAINKALSSENGDMNKLYTAGNKNLTNMANNNSTAVNKLNDALDKAQSVSDSNKDLINDLESFAQALPDGEDKDNLNNQIQNLKDNQNQFDTAANDMNNQKDKLNNALDNNSEAQKELGDLVDQHVNNLENSRQKIVEEVIPSISKALDQLSTSCGKMAAILDDVPSQVDSMDLVLTQLQQNLVNTGSALNNEKDVLTSLQTQLGKASSDIGLLQSSVLYQKIQSMQDIDVDAISSFMYSPVTITTEELYYVSNYGSAMTPFYTNLALWVGGLVLVSIFKQEVAQDTLEYKKTTVNQMYFGRLMTFEAIGLIQGLVTCVGNLILPGIHIDHPVYFVLTGIFCSFVYVNLIYALAITFKHIGKALAVILVILQIPGSSGTYPIQMLPNFFQKMYPILPFTYGIDAMRETIAGFYDHYWIKNLGILALYVPIALLIGIVLRPLLMNLNNMFDKKLMETEFMVGETETIKKKRPHAKMFIQAILNDDESKGAIAEKSAKFEIMYPKLIKIGMFAMLIIPSIFLILMFGLDSRLVFLAIWVILIIGIAAYLIVVEYLHERITQQLELAGLTSDDLIRKLREEEE